MSHLRRAKRSDVLAINELIGTQAKASPNEDDFMRTLARRFGDYFDIESIIEESPYSAVAYDDDTGTIIGFFAVHNGPPIYVDGPGQFSEEHQLTPTCQSNWLNWFRRCYDVPDVELYNTKFVSFFIAEADISVKFLDTALKDTFFRMGNLDYIFYLLPEHLALFVPLSATVLSDEAKSDDNTMAMRASPRTRRRETRYFAEAPARGNEITFSLHMCTRKTVLPVLEVRMADIGDADDLIPMFANQELIEGDPDEFLADLLSSETQEKKTVVGETHGKVMGFMTFSRDISYEALSEQYQFEPFFSYDADNNEATAVAPSGGNVTSTEHDEDIDSTLRSEQAGQKNGSANTESALERMFYIPYFYMDPVYKHNAIQLVRAGFDLYPDLDFCAVVISSVTPELPFMRSFISVAPKPGYEDLDCLYVVHRSSIQSPLAVNPGTVEDIAAVKQLLKDNIPEVMKTFRETLFTGKTLTFTVRNDSVLVGFIITSVCDDLKPLVDQFAIQTWMNVGKDRRRLAGKPVILEHFIVHPVFHNCARWIFEAGATCLLHIKPHSSTEESVTDQIAFQHMVPIRPRRPIQFPDNMRDGQPVHPPIMASVRAVFVNTIYDARHSVNDRIIVVGASDTGIAFIESLVYTPGLYFTSITLVSPTGLPLQDDSARSRHQEHFVSHYSYRHNELEQLGLQHYITVYEGEADGIDRISRLVTLTNDDPIPYDFLFLTPGLQFDATLLNDELAQVDGVLSVNAINTDFILDNIANAAMHDEDSKIVVYGRDLQTYACVEWLLQQHVTPTRIVLAAPPLRYPASCFANPVVDEKVHAVLRHLGVTVYRGCSLAKWQEEDGAITAPEAAATDLRERWQTKPPSEVIHISKVVLFLYADERTVSPTAFSAVNDSSIVFDGRVIIDKYFRTQDPFIYAAGSVTKYSSRYQTAWSHELYDARDVGSELGWRLIHLWKPLAQEPKLIDDDQILRLEAPKKTLAILPGSLRYFRMDRPCLPTDTFEHRKGQPDYGQDLVIDDLNLETLEGTYFGIHIDKDRRIQSLTYLGRSEIPLDNYTSLFGLQAGYLNRLIERYEEGIITDFRSFLAEPWALPIYYDKLRPFTAHLAQETVALSSNDEALREVVETLREHLSLNEKIEMDESRQLYKAFDNSAPRTLLDKKVFEYLLECEIFQSYP
ncbi:hypothetical protein BC832DRAFT_529739 [Gaertneriomyces semiglobifer]|nr:hypothetical protein BC832DRAFT_529739 [Gaertneriomyces semiglobifer]